MDRIITTARIRHLAALSFGLLALVGCRQMSSEARDPAVGANGSFEYTDEDLPTTRPN